MNLIKVTSYREMKVFESRSETVSQIIEEEYLNAFVDALLHLHHFPGRNPRNKAKAPSIWKITYSKLEKKAPYWWSTPGLRDSIYPDREKYPLRIGPLGPGYFDDGVPVFSFGEEKVVWEKEYLEVTSLNENYCTGRPGTGKVSCR